MPIHSFHHNNCELTHQKAHDDFVKKLAKNPGQHSRNIIRQELSNTFLHCLSLATSVQSDINGMTTSSNGSATSLIYPSAHDFTCASQYDPSQSIALNKGTQKTQNNHCPDHLSSGLVQEVFQAFDKFTRLQTADLSLREPGAKTITPCRQSVTIAKMVGKGITTLLNKMSGLAYQASDFISYYDPLRIRQVDAFSYNTNNQIQVALNRRIINNESDIENPVPDKTHYISENQTELHEIIDKGREAISRFYSGYSDKNPGLKELATKILKEKIKQQFKLDIDPDHVYFMQFDMSMYDGDKLLQYGPPIVKKTLTEYLFTNFGREVQDYLVNVNVVSGIYDISQEHIRVHDSSDAIKIKPTDFIQLVWDIDFYNYAKVKLTDDFSHKNEHIKNHFISFINHLDSSQINSDSAKDALNGAGILKNNNVSVVLFDINQYSTANAFVFRNQDSNRVTLYFPMSDFKFISFRGDFEMRTWVTHACATEEHRKMLASHFTIANRQDGLFYCGVDTWLNSINLDNGYADRIAIQSTQIPAEHFFEVLFNNVKDKTLSDLDSQVKSDAEVRRDMWEEMADASNIIPNPVSPFLSLAMHIEHAINADTYQEKLQEWRKIENDAVNLITLVVLDKAIKLPDTAGYEFIEAVAKGVDDENIRELSKMLQGNDESPVPEYHIFNPQSPGWDWLFDDKNSAPLSPGGNNAPVNNEPYFDPASPEWEWLLKEKNGIHKKIKQLTKFLPPRTIRHTDNIELLNKVIYDSVFKSLQEKPFDIYYGLENDKTDTPEYIKHARIGSRTALKAAQNHIKSAINTLNTKDLEENIKSYLSSALDTTDQNIITEAVSRLRYQVQRTDNYLTECEATSFKNIAFVSTKQVVNPRNKFLFKSSITDLAYLKKIEMGFSSKFDPYRRIFFMLDVSHEIRVEGNNIINRNDDLINGVIMHEGSHMSTDTMDIIYNEDFDRIFDPGNPKALLDKFNHYLTKDILKKNKDFELFMRMVYTHLGITMPYDADVAIDMVKNDHMLKANLLMNNADNFVTFVKYLSALSDNARNIRSTKKRDNADIDAYITLIFTATRDFFVKFP
ncbi:aminotransferase [Erwinia pyrifoliae]|uniref:dermonecrotic toxin domain-containing protein n=1 Tax=Erwinia pyrifoliae TaxID=79967 RepID=UPI0021D7D082|nr:DUF6543 domain-containing protein [Erwinia pyrifoliae]MCU8586102.1 aminotransferase [Erwinia pyrifoliae]